MIANPNDGNTPQVEQATPSISVSSGGLITATTEQEAGYVPGGSKSATKQLTTQAAKTVTPGTTAQTAVASGRYTTGDVDVAGDANLKAENIAEGVSIFGVSGTHKGGGGMTVVASGTLESLANNSMPSVSLPASTQYVIASYIDLDGFVHDTALIHRRGMANLGMNTYMLYSTGEKFGAMNGVDKGKKINYIAIG